MLLCLCNVYAYLPVSVCGSVRQCVVASVCVSFYVRGFVCVIVYMRLFLCACSCV